VGWTIFHCSSKGNFKTHIRVKIGSVTLLQNLLVWGLFFFFCETGFWTHSFVPAKQVLYCLSHTSSPVILEMGSQELFAQAGLKPWSSWSQPLK
jgi:hypothetical protein